MADAASWAGDALSLDHLWVVEQLRHMAKLSEKADASPNQDSHQIDGDSTTRSSRGPIE